MLFRTLILWLVYGSLIAGRGETFEPFAGPQPIAVLIQENPRVAVIGAETPRIAIYENGDVIYCRDSPKQKQPFYLKAKLSFGALSPVMEQLNAVTQMQDLKRFYSLTDVADRGRALFYLQVDGKMVVTSVYGLTPAAASEADLHSGNNPGLAAVIKLYQYLQTIEFTESEPWRPVYIEAMIWPDEDSSDAVIGWLKGWPDLDSPRARKRPHGWSIFLDGSMQDDLAHLLVKQGEKGAVEISGKKWSVAYRSTFPSEPVWRKAFV